MSVVQLRRDSENRASNDTTNEHHQCTEFAHLGGLGVARNLEREATGWSWSRFRAFTLSSTNRHEWRRISRPPAAPMTLAIERGLWRAAAVSQRLKYENSPWATLRLWGEKFTEFAQTQRPDEF